MENSLETALVQMFFQRQREPKPSISLLNEMQQQHLLREVIYPFSQTGAQHQPHFVVECCVATPAGRKWMTSGEGGTKKEAATQAAAEMILILRGQAQMLGSPEEKERVSEGNEEVNL